MPSRPSTKPAPASMASPVTPLTAASASSASRSRDAGWVKSMKLVRVVMTGSVFGFYRHGDSRAIAVRVPSMGTPLREVDYVTGNGGDAPACAMVAHDTHTDDRKSPARM